MNRLDPYQRRILRAQGVLDLLGTGFGRDAIALAGIDEELVAAEDALEQQLEDEVERPQAQRLPASEVSRRSACPPHLYRRLYGS